MFSHFFIDRPIFATVISLVIVIAGAVAMFSLPISQYPDITPVQIQVTATYPGADAETVAQNVGAPIEQQVNGADNMIYMQSTSSSTGNYTLNAYFEIGTDPQLAQVDVQNRVQWATPQLPSAVTEQGVIVKKTTQSFMLVIALYSPDGRYDPDYVANYANIYLLDAIKRINGANQAAILGVPDYAMRIWLRPDRMAQLGLTATDIATAVGQQNRQFAVGRIGQSPTPHPVPQTFPVTTPGLLTEPEQFENIILRAREEGAAITRVKDVGRVDLGRKDYSIRSQYQGKDATLIVVYQQPGANALEVAKQVYATLDTLSKSFPDGLEYDVALDTTKFVSASIDEVVHTFFEAVVLVVLVVFIFLQSLRLTIIPTLAVPVSILGAMIGMLAFGFSVNMLTLFGMILAIGIVVDDAIVVIENTERNMTQFGLSPKDAAKRAMTEVSGALVAIVLVLNAVFIPVAFLGGMTGQLYKQFAVTIAISVVFSGLVALTLSPALAAILLKPGHGEKHGFFKWFESVLEKVTHAYVTGTRWIMRRTLVAFSAFAVVVVAAGWLFSVWPGAFVPEEDQGYLFVPYFLPDAASLDRTQAVGEQAAAFMREQPAVANVTQVDGYSLIDQQFKTDRGLLFVSLKDFEERKGPELSAPALIQASARHFAGIRDGRVIPLNPPAIPGLGVTAGFEMWVQQRGDGNYAQLADQVKQIVAKARQHPKLVRVSATISAENRQLRAILDREKAETLGVPVSDVYDTLQTLFGSLYVNQFPKAARLWQVILQAEPEYRLKPEDINGIYVRNHSGDMVPLSALVDTEWVTGPDIVTRFNNYPAAKITGGAAPGVSSGEALDIMEQIANQTLPGGYGFEWAGESREEKLAGSTSSLAFVFGLIFVFLILAAQYESWTLPFGVIMAVPFALLGALLAIVLRGIPNDVYFQIGLLTLIALAAKNAILIVEFAVDLHREGKSLYDSAVEAARLRFRPILMTSFAFILGVVPLAIATGASANSRHSIGTGVIGGMLGATAIAIFFVPMFFLVLEKLGLKLSGKKNEGSGEGGAAPTPGTASEKPGHE
ncbi:MAG TPA: multidrug efflux RND transporter permease subunit [Gammaproteobacteria bacterium]|nr:multidrug efflux RND transporter permease subunit [Gammaproteobacteria bacterium]